MTKTIRFLLALTGMTFLVSHAIAQNVGINDDNTQPDPSAILDIKSADKGLLIPRVQLDDLNSEAPASNPATGLLIYANSESTVDEGFYYWNGSSWVKLTTGVSTDNDSDPTNELQDLNLSDNTLSLSDDATTVDLSGYLDNTDDQSLAEVLTNGNSAGNAIITNLADPVSAQDAATKNYVDNASGGGGGSSWTIDGDDIYYNTGNVAIGTASGTDARLNIDVTELNDGIKIQNNGTNIGLRINNGADAHNALNISNNSTDYEAIRISHSGTSEAVDIDHSGASGHAVRIDITNSANPDRVIWAETKGMGIPGWFEIDNISNNSPALIAVTNGTGYAGEFEGDVRIWGDLDVEGDLDKGTGSFKIDHPLDPENKYLFHSFVESPDMMNIYNGNLVMNENGEGVVSLPGWFEVLNRTFRYQLTCIGGYAPIYIAEEISNKQFKIAGGVAGLKVSWQVTGIRKDPYSEKNRIETEVVKSEEERGYYLHHEAYDQPYEKSIKSLRGKSED